jgi:hypothetical protein
MRQRHVRILCVFAFAFCCGAWIGATLHACIPVHGACELRCETRCAEPGCSLRTQLKDTLSSPASPCLLCQLAAAPVDAAPAQHAPGATVEDVPRSTAFALRLHRGARVRLTPPAHAPPHIA